MEFKNSLRRCLITAKPKKYNCCLKNCLYKELEYKLSSKLDESEQDPSSMNIEQITKYISKKYIEVDKFDCKGQLLNDLIIFKTYRDELKLTVEDQTFFISILAIAVSLIAIVQSLDKAYINKIIKINALTLFVVLTILVLGLYFYYRVRENSDFNKLKYINNAIYILEAIEQNLVEVHGTRKFDIEIDNVVDQASEPKKYSFKIDEINEEKNKDTIEGKN